MTKKLTQESNNTGLSVAREASLGKLPANPIWYGRAPNSYKDTGPSFKSKARAPINASRQQSKGVVVDRDAAAGWQEDLTLNDISNVLEAVMFAAYRTKGDVAVGTVSAADGYHPAAGGDYFKSGDIIAGYGFVSAANNGRKLLAQDGTAADVNVAGTADEANSGGRISKVGHVFPAGDLSIVAYNDGTYHLQSAAGLLAALSVIPGETIYIGDDNANAAFGGGIGGFCRVREVAGGSITLDKMQFPGADAGAGKSIAVYVGRALKNESDPELIKMFTYCVERTLGKADTADPHQQAEYIYGNAVDKFSMANNTADKVTCEFSLVGTQYNTVTSQVGQLPGTRVPVHDSDAFTTSNDLVMTQLNIVGHADPLYAYFTDISLDIDNNIKPNKALSVLGAFDLSAGNFVVSLSANAYFADVEAQKAIVRNDNATVAFAYARNNVGIHFDVPLVTLGDGKPKVASNQPITVALTMDAARATLVSPLTDHTLFVVLFDYLPSVAHGNPQ